MHSPLVDFHLVVIGAPTLMHFPTADFHLGLGQRTLRPCFPLVILVHRLDLGLTTIRSSQGVRLAGFVHNTSTGRIGMRLILIKWLG